MDTTGQTTEFGHAMRSHFLQDPKWTNFNHGSFGNYPLPVRDALREFQTLSDAAPDKFMRYQYIELLDKARERLANLVHAPLDECVMVLNATTGMDVVLRNLTWEPKDAILYFDTVYPAVEKGLLYLVERHDHVHLRPVSLGPDFGHSLPPTHSEILNAFSQAISRLLYEGYKPKMAVFDTILSLPGVRFPFERLTKICKEYGILSLIDGAHGVGHIPLNLSLLDPDFFVSNCHKWLFTPRGCALFYVPKRNQHLIRSALPTSHGFRPKTMPSGRRLFPTSVKSDFVDMFQYVGTADNSPYYCIPVALDFRANVCGGEDAIYRYVCDMAQQGGDLLAKILETEVMDDLDSDEAANIMNSSDRWAGRARDCAMANILLPVKIVESPENGLSEEGATDCMIVNREDVPTHIDWMHDTLVQEFDTYVHVYDYDNRLWFRICGQIYLELKDFEWLGGIMMKLCTRMRAGESLKAQQVGKV